MCLIYVRPACGLLIMNHGILGEETVKTGWRRGWQVWDKEVGGRQKTFIC